MASDLNKAILVGRITKDPEQKFLQSGAVCISFSLAVNYSYTQNHEKKEQVSFFTCVLWGEKRCEPFVKYVHKGDRLGITGRLQQRTWDDQNGNKRSTVEIIVEDYHFLQGKRDGGSGSGSNNTPEQPPLPQGQDDDNPFSDDGEIPF
ncbi:MAG TPA: single-stranded DNA-binding protein [Spirochaetota bacterium]|nr:single-stranded DNA-binding protein [Spirochaetota bacterium]